MGGAARTVSKWIPNEIKKAIPVEISKAIPKEIAPALSIVGFPGVLGIAAMQNLDRQTAEAKAIDDQAKATEAAQAKQLYDIQHPNIVGQVTMGGAAGSSDPTLTASQNIGPTSAGDNPTTTFTTPAAMMKAQKGAPTYSRPGGAGAALAQQAQEQSNFRLPSVSGLTFGGS